MRQRRSTPATQGMIAVVGEPAPHLVAQLSSERLVPVPSRRLAPLHRAYRTAALGLIAEPAAMPAAVAVQRLTRVTWIGVLDDATLERVMAHGNRIQLRALRRAAALVVAPHAAERIRSVAPLARVVECDDSGRLARLIDDVALAPDARSARSSLTPSMVPDAWSFLNDRGTRLAIRLVASLGKAPVPTHPKHLVDAPWHHWFHSELRETDDVLDVGCADGTHTLAAAPRVRSIVGVDVDAMQLWRARTRAEAIGIRNVRFERGDLSDARTLELFRAERFDVVLVLDVLEHLSDRRLFLGQVRSLLRPGGRLVITFPNRDTSYKRWRRRAGGFAYSDPDHKVEYAEPDIFAELGGAGFRVLTLERGGYDTPFPGFTALVGALSLRAYRRISERRQQLAVTRPDEATAFRVIAAARDLAAPGSLGGAEGIQNRPCL